MSLEPEFNLYAPGTVLFDTHVTWGDIERDMLAALGTGAHFGPNKKIRTIGDDKGFMSRICLVDPDWQYITEDEKLPGRFVVKVGLDATLVVCTLVAAMGVTRRMIESRPELKEALLKKIENLESHLRHLHNEPRGLHQPLRALAALQAASLKFTDEEKAIFTQNPLQDILKTIFTEESVLRTFTMLKGLGNGSFNPLAEKLEENWPEILNPKKFDDIPRDLGMTPVFCHGDLWSTNLLWSKNEDQLQLKAIVDYQVAHFGNPAGDLSRLFGATLSAADRRSNWETLLKVFYGFLVEELDGSEAPYTLDQLKTAYCLYFPAGAWMLLPVIGPLYAVVSRNADPEEKEEVDKIVMEKAMGLLEDLLSYHEQNSKH